MPKGHSAVVSVRYMIDDVGAAVAFYTNHLGFTLDWILLPHLLLLRVAIFVCCSVGKKALAGNRCPMERNPSRGAGIEY